MELVKARYDICAPVARWCGWIELLKWTKMKGQTKSWIDAQAYSSPGHPTNMSQNHGYQTLEVRQLV